MNYDSAHALAAAMRNSEEFKKLQEAQKLVEADPTALDMVRRFMNQQMQWEYAKMTEAPEEEELLKKQEELVLMINNNAAARDYLQAHVRWSQTSQDVYNIVTEPITESMKLFEEQ